jgi:hypothetical protein
LPSAHDAPVVRDTDLKHAALELRKLRSDLRLETETVFFDADALNLIFSERL